MNIVLINQFFPPAQAPTGVLLADVAGELARRGHAVTVIASPAGYGAEGAAAAPEIDVIRVGSRERHRSGIAAKINDYGRFYRGVGRALAQLKERPDVVVCMTTPPFIGLAAARLWRRRGIPYVLWCMDLYPEALVAHQLLRPQSLLLACLNRLARRERRNAARVIALGADMARLLTESGAARVVEIPPWSCAASSQAELAARELRRRRGWADEDVVLLYSGNMGRAHRADEFAALAKRLRGQTPRCRFVFAGDGPRRAQWEQQWGEWFEFIPGVAAEERDAHLLAADVHLVSQQPDWKGIVVPSKFPAACALGRPVLFAGPPDSAVGNWLAQADTGWLLPPGDSSAIEAVACELSQCAPRERKGECARELYNRLFTPEQNYHKMIAVITDAAGVTS